MRLALKAYDVFIDWRSNETFYSFEPGVGSDLLLSGLNRTHPFKPMMAPINRVAPMISTHAIWI
jgi:hypothetical protein